MPGRSASERIGKHSGNMPAASTQLAYAEIWCRGSLSGQQRIAFTDAVTCLQSKPSKIPAGVAPGAKSRFDDFIATHINQSLIIHNSGYFFAWHRQYLLLFEQALINECGYTGTIPYWNWPLYPELETSILFDGSATSLGSNGAYNATLSVTNAGPAAPLPNGTGGGCIQSGPFVNQVVPFSPIPYFSIFAFAGVLPANRFDYTPRCLSRNLNSYLVETYDTQNTVNALLNATDIAEFSLVMNGIPNTATLGPHVAGHVSFQGANDFFGAPSDPAFYLHHGMVDLTWTLFQANNPEQNQYALFGTRSTLNIPPTANATLDDYLHFDYLGPDVQVRDAMKVGVQPYCYVYDYGTQNHHGGWQE